MTHIRTPLGALITLNPAPEHLQGESEGFAMLTLSMDHPMDPRQITVILSKENRAALAEVLMEETR